MKTIGRAHTGPSYRLSRVAAVRRRRRRRVVRRRYHDVIVHGRPTGLGAAPSLGADGTNSNRRVLARPVEQDPTQPSGLIRLLSCSTWAPGASAAQNLANKLGVDVLAPSDTLFVFDSDRLTIGSTPNAKTGRWVPFSLGRPA